MRPAVRDRVWRVIEQQGYAPRAAARSLASRRTNVIALLIPRSAAFIFSDPFFPQAIQGITETCNSRRYFLMLSMLTADLEERFYRHILRGHHFDGVILLASDLDDPILPLLVKDRVQLVLIGRHPAFRTLDWVDVENRDAARQAVEHLPGLGHRRVATITGGTLTMAVALDRRDGYQQALQEAGIPIAPELIVEGDFTQEGGYRAMTRLLQLPERPTAVFVASDALAIGALSAIRAAGLAVPDDIAIVGFDDLPIASYASPPLTTMRQPIYELGARAAELLIERLERPQRERAHLSLQATLVVRQSCGAAARSAHDEKGGQRHPEHSPTSR